MKTARNKCKLGKFVNLKRGYDLPNQERTTGQYPIVSSSGITDFHKDFMVEGPGVVTGRYGTLGKVFYIPGRYWPLNTSLYVQDFKGNVPKFIYYYLGVVLSANFDSAGAVPGVNRNILHKLTVPEPPKTQHKIVSVLSAYDDLIENNKRRIAILEKMAEEIYREWFVRMRFSSYANASVDKPVNSNDSNFWSPGQRVPINRLVKFLSGYSFKSQDYSPSGRFGIVTIKNVHDGLYIPDCSDRIEEPPSNMKKYCHLRDGDILMSLTGNVGRVCRVHGTGNLLNQRVAKLAPAIEGTEDFVYWFFRNSSVQTLCELISTGAAQQNLSPIKLGDQLAPLPSIDQIKHFCAVVKSTTEHISNLLKQNQNLTLSRDLLLPRLISGKLSVEDLELPSNEKLTAVSSALSQQELAHA